jgi:effector-binding domain-containing protein
MSRSRIAAVIALALVLGFKTSLAQPATSNVPPEDKTTSQDPDRPSPLQPGDPFGEEVILPERTIIYMKGKSNWETAFVSLVKSFKSLHDYLNKQGIKTNGAAIAIYTQTDETGFEFEAALPVAETPTNPPTGDIAVGQAPSGKTLKFTHRGSYTSMETTYEAINDYFDDKGLEAKNLLIEEYSTDPTVVSADNLVISVFVPVK